MMMMTIRPSADRWIHFSNRSNRFGQGGENRVNRINKVNDDV
jgi:hypothetical protein